jgi:hypothetical protein
MWWRRACAAAVSTPNRGLSHERANDPAQRGCVRRTIGRGTAERPLSASPPRPHRRTLRHDRRDSENAYGEHHPIEPWAPVRVKLGSGVGADQRPRRHAGRRRTMQRAHLRRKGISCGEWTRYPISANAMIATRTSKVIFFRSMVTTPVSPPTTGVRRPMTPAGEERMPGVISQRDPASPWHA